MVEIAAPRILSYEPRIVLTSNNGEVFTVQFKVPDYTSDEEVLRWFADCFKVETVGELLEAVRGYTHPLRKGERLVPPYDVLGVYRGVVGGRRVWSHDERLVG